MPVRSPTDEVTRPTTLKDAYLPYLYIGAALNNDQFEERDLLAKHIHRRELQHDQPGECAQVVGHSAGVDRGMPYPYAELSTRVFKIKRSRMLCSRGDAVAGITLGRHPPPKFLVWDRMSTRKSSSRWREITRPWIAVDDSP